MKKRLVLIVLLLILPSVNALVNIESTSRSVYNLGDEIKLNGYLIQDKDFSGLLNLVLVCDREYRLPPVTVSLLPGEKKQFPEEFSIPKLIVPSFVDEGSCYIKASLVKSGLVVDEGVSNEFSVSKELRGNFNIDKTKVQVGESVVITGNIFKINGVSIEGSAQFYFGSDGERYLVDMVDVRNGIFTYDYKLSSIVPGMYNIDIAASDVYGNNYIFENVSSILVVNELVVDAELDKSSVYPGQIVGVKGDVKTLIGDKIKGGRVNVYLDDMIYNLEIEDNKFDLEIKVPEKIKSGEHLVNVSVEDLDGNSGSLKLKLFVKGVAKALINEINSKSFKPGDSIAVKPLYFDQAGDLIIESIGIEVYNPKNKKIFSDVTKTDKEIRFDLLQFALPGSWKVVSFVSDLKTEDVISVKEVVEAEASLDNQTILIRNIGNVIFDKPISINADKYSIVKKVSLEPNETLSVKLGRELASGRYDIMVVMGDKEQSFEDVLVLGVGKMDYRLVYVVIGIVVLAVLYYLFKGRKKRRVRRHRERERAKEHIAKLKEKKKEEKKINRWKSSEEDVKDFRDRILKDIRKVEDKKKS